MPARPLVLLTDAIAPAQQERLAQHAEIQVCNPSDAQFMPLASRAAALIVRNPIAAEFFVHAPKLRGVVRHGAGLDMIPVQHASDAAVAVANVPAVNARSVAEHVVAQMLGLARHLNIQNQWLRTQGWAPARQRAMSGQELHTKTLAIVGMGAVGQAVARICHAGLGMRVLGIQRTQRDGDGTFEPMRLEDALPCADVVVLACPLTDETRGLINEARLSSFKLGALLINVSRGAVVDDIALVKAIREGRLGGAALDVFVEQPLPENSELRQCDQVLLTPHTAGITQESMQAMSRGAVDQVLQILQGQLPTHLVNRDQATRIQARWQQL
jgi:D-3-phosphoglycerate dehydrogenase